MSGNVVSGIMLKLLLIGMLTLAFNIQPVKSEGTIYIRPDGSIDPSTAPINRQGDIYTFTGNINNSIVVERDNIVINGTDYTLSGRGSGKGVDLNDRSNVTVKNMEIKAFRCGISLYGSSNNMISGNRLRANIQNGISLDTSSNNTISGNHIKNYYLGHLGVWLQNSSNHNTISENNITENSEYGIALSYSSNNSIYHNSLINNKQQVFSEESANVWDDGYPSGGNYWSNHNPPDEDKDKIGDKPYVMDDNNTDRYPLIYPYEFYQPGYEPKPDLNGDGIINIIDVATVARAFGCKPGDKRWNPTADLDISETINIIDVAKVARLFGRKWP